LDVFCAAVHRLLGCDVSIIEPSEWAWLRTYLLRVVDGSYVYRRNSASTQNYHVALHLVRARCRVCIFPKGRREAVSLLFVRNIKGKWGH
jgi:hypothetical protein